MESYAQINQEHFPVVQITFTGSVSTDENFKAYLDGNETCYDKQKPLVIIFDATKASLPSLRHQKMQAEWLREHKALMQTFCLGTAYVIPNTALRLVLKMIFTLQKQPVPFAIFDDLSSATNWAQLQLEKKA
jgi:hypothetical protein